eukprot:maker-scaffold412_size179788-snap-gene-0.22 protein:Tk11834 transcript:maker-scaffold412_size179788-snap-gene-0.22-mRNA-1 annotation:"PREDICTED: uncharacterized protein LOC100867995"
MCCKVNIKIPLWLHLMLALWAVFLSVLEFLVFLFYFGNAFLAVSGISAVVPAALCFHMYSMEKSGNVQNVLSPSSTNCLYYFGALGFLFSCAAAITYFTLGLVWMVPVFEMDRTLILCGLEALLTSRWFYQLAHLSQKHIKSISRGRSKEITI